MKSKKDYIHSVDRIVMWQNIKIFGSIFILCLTALCFIYKPKNEPQVASSQVVKKFEKVEDENSIGMLAGNINQKETESVEMKKIGEFKAEDDSYVKIDLSGTKSSNEFIKNDENITPFDTYTKVSSNIRNIPSMDGEILDTVSANYKVTVVAENGDWNKINWGTDGYAYIHKDCLKK